MDPNEALIQLRRFVALSHAGARFTAEDVDQAAEAAHSLDEWLSAGGFMPEDWAKARTRQP